MCLLNFVCIVNSLGRIYLKRVNCYLRELDRVSEEGHFHSSVTCSQAKAFLLAKARTLKSAGFLAKSHSIGGLVHWCIKSRMVISRQRWATRTRSVVLSDVKFSHQHQRIWSCLYSEMPLASSDVHLASLQQNSSELYQHGLGVDSLKTSLVLDSTGSSFSGFVESDLNHSAYQKENSMS